MSSAPEKAPKVPKDYSGCAKFGLCILAFPLSFLSVVIVEGASRYFWIALVTWIIGVSLELTISYYFYFIRLIGTLKELSFQLVSRHHCCRLACL